MKSLKRYILIVDQGTTSTRSILYNEKIKPVATEQIKVKQYFPYAGWSEQDPEEIWKTVSISLRNSIVINNL